MFKHTQGPWAVKLQNAGSKGRIIWASYGETKIADCHCNAGSSLENQQANARLIAAAPELLDALDAITTLIVEQPDGCIYEIEGIARTVIRKATRVA